MPLQALVAKSQLAISLCCSHLSGSAATLLESLLIATGSFPLHQSNSCSNEDVSFHAEVWHVCEAPSLRPDGVSSCHLLYRLEMPQRCALSSRGSRRPQEAWLPPHSAAHYKLRTMARDLPPAEPGPAVASGPLPLAPSPNPAKPKTKCKVTRQEGGKRDKIQ